MFHRHLILQMGGLVVALVVVDAEGKAAGPYRSACTCGLWGEEPRSYRGHNDEGGEIVEVGDIGTKGEAGDLGVMPVDGERDGRVAKDAEVEGVVGVLPDVVSAEDQVLAEGLLEASMKLVAVAGLQVP